MLSRIDAEAAAEAMQLLEAEVVARELLQAAIDKISGASLIYTRLTCLTPITGLLRPSFQRLISFFSQTNTHLPGPTHSCALITHQALCPPSTATLPRLGAVASSD
jgi:hypothetical protein